MKELILWVYVLVPTPQCVDQWRARMAETFVLAGSTFTLRRSDLAPESEPRKIVTETEVPPVRVLKEVQVPHGVACYDVYAGKKTVKLVKVQK